MKGILLLDILYIVTYLSDFMKYDITAKKKSELILKEEIGVRPIYSKNIVNLF